jgi:hypothetical protein
MSESLELAQETLNSSYQQVYTKSTGLQQQKFTSLYPRMTKHQQHFHLYINISDSSTTKHLMILQVQYKLQQIQLLSKHAS